MSETNYTPAQLEAWAGCTAKYPEPITQDLWNERVALFAEAKQHAPALARLVLEKDAEIARLRFGLNGIANLIKTNIIENDGPNRFHLDGVSYEGPEVDAFFRILRGLEKIARQAMKETSDGLF